MLQPTSEKLQENVVVSATLWDCLKIGKPKTLMVDHHFSHENTFETAIFGCTACHFWTSPHPQNQQNFNVPSDTQRLE